MNFRKLVITGLVALLASGPAFAQTAVPTPLPKPNPLAPVPSPPPLIAQPTAPQLKPTPGGSGLTGATSPNKPAANTQKVQAPTPVTTKVNLNTADATELDALPQIGPARAKVILASRKKIKFKDWDDFLARKIVPSNAATAIKDLVTF